MKSYSRFFHFETIFKSQSVNNIFSYSDIFYAVLLFALFALPLASPPSAHASYLTIDGVAKITASVQGEQVILTGTYRIDNKGDEEARNVFPSFKLIHWAWSGDPRTINYASSQLWEINISFSRKLLETQEVGTESLKKGIFPIVILRNYEDINGVLFSAPDIQAVTIGNLSQAELNDVRVPEINSTFKCDGNGKQFSCTLDLVNHSDSVKKIETWYHSSREIQLDTSTRIVEMEPRSRLQLQSQVANFSGLNGSSYAVFAVSTWVSNGLRKFKKSSTNVKVDTPDLKYLYVLAAALFFVVMASLVYRIVYKK